MAEGKIVLERAGENRMRGASHTNREGWGVRASRGMQVVQLEGASRSSGVNRKSRASQPLGVKLGGESESQIRRSLDLESEPKSERKLVVGSEAKSREKTKSKERKEKNGKGTKANKKITISYTNQC